MPKYRVTLSRLVTEIADIIITASSEKRAIAEIEAYPRDYMATADWSGRNVSQIDEYPKIEEIVELL